MITRSRIAELEAHPGLSFITALRAPEVADQHHLAEAEALAHREQGGAEGGRVGEVPGEDLDGHGAALSAGDEAVGDLQRAALAVAGVAARGQRAVPAGEVRRREVEEHEAAGSQVT